MTNGPPFTYTLTGPADADTGIVSPAGMDGGDGGWPVLFGTSPVTPTQLSLAIDEDQVGDSDRGHTTEQVAYMVFDAPQADCTASRPAPAEQWLFFSLPCMPADAAASRVFEQGPSEADYGYRWLIYAFEAATQSYTYLGANDLLVAGKGYTYLSLDAFNPIRISGTHNAGTPIPLTKSTDTGDWNLVGNPYNGSVDWTSVTVFDGISTHNFADMDPSAGGYDCEQTPTVGPDCVLWHVMNMWNGNAYIPHDGNGGDPGTLQPFDAMWVRSHRADSISLTMAAPDMPLEADESSLAEISTDQNAGGPSGQNDKQDKTKSSEWYMQLVVESGELSDDGNWLGQAENAVDGLDSRDLEEWSPYSNPYLSIVFTNPLFDEVAWGYTTDYRAPTKNPEGEWPFVVRASSGINEVTLSWNGEKELFAKAWLVDEVSGKTIKIKQGGNYTFNMSGSEHPMRILIGR
jgi:hypothetical protein